MGKLDRQNTILEVLKHQGTGVVNISDAKLSLLTGIPQRTLSRDLSEMEGQSIIIRETRIVHPRGQSFRHRDIIIKGEPQRRFSLEQHRALSNKDNHRITQTSWGEVIWERRVNGAWQRNMEQTEFKSIKQAYSWMYRALWEHQKKAAEGEQFSRN